MIKIGDFAKICNVSTQTLRYYDAEGILKADVTDPFSGYRFYSLDAVEKYKQIVFYKNLGFSLNEIKAIQCAKGAELREILQNKKAELSQSVHRFKEQIQAIDHICDENEEKPVLSEALLLPFENDPQVIGKWRLCGKLLDENNLDACQEVDAGTADQEIIFMPGGAFAWKYFWTKGILYRISPKYKFAIPNLYRTLEQNGSRYMIVQFMSDDCLDHGEDTLMLLYRQVDEVAYTEHRIRPNIDQTDLPFVEDKTVYGTWLAFDFVPELSDFHPQKKYSEDHDIYMVDIRFFARGMCSRTMRTMSGYVSQMLRYTKGVVLNDKEMTAEKYLLRTINGKEFLFVQHKSGDYFYGGQEPHWYVFERKEP